MCKSLCYSYACSHKHYFYLSICHGSHTYIPWKRSSTPVPRLACQGWPLISILSPQLCGPCNREAALAKLDEAIAELEGQYDVEAEEIAQARANRNSGLYRISQRYPGHEINFQPSPRPEQGGDLSRRTISTRRERSILGKEVLLHDVVFKEQHLDCAVWSWDSWDEREGKGHSPLENEVEVDAGEWKAEGCSGSWSAEAGQNDGVEDGAENRLWHEESWGQMAGQGGIDSSTASIEKKTDVPDPSEVKAIALVPVCTIENQDPSQS